MSERKGWYLVTYDIRDQKRWRKLYKLMRGYGERLQYSVFRCWLSERQLEKLRWQVEKTIDSEDAVLFVGLCEACAGRISARNRPESWDRDDEDELFKVL